MTLASIPMALVLGSPETLTLNSSVKKKIDPKNHRFQSAAHTGTTRNANEAVPTHANLHALHANYQESLAESQQAAFLSATINGKLDPVKGKMTVDQQSVFQEGMQQFLQEMMNEEARQMLTILSVTITTHELAPMDEKISNEPEALIVQSVVSAQQTLTDTTVEFVSKAEFGEMVVNLMNIFDAKLMKIWEDGEAASIVENEGMEFKLLENIKMELYAPQATTVVGKKVGLTTIIIASFIGGILLVTLLIVIQRNW